MRSMALTAALAAIVVSLPLSMASAGGRDRDRGNDHGGGGHHDSNRGKDHGGKDHGHHGHHGKRERGPDHIQGPVNTNALAIAGSKGFTDSDLTGSEALTYGKKPPTCSPYKTTWNCIPPHGYGGYR